MSIDTRPQFSDADREAFLGHWTEAEIASTCASWQCIASFLGYIERVSETPPREADKAMVIKHIKMRLAEDPAYDEWAHG